MTLRQPSRPATRQRGYGGAQPEPILDRDPNADLWRKVGIPKSRDIRRLRPASLPPRERFETLHDVAMRKSNLVEALQDLEPALAEAYDNRRARSRAVHIVRDGIEAISTAKPRASTNSPPQALGTT